MAFIWNFIIEKSHIKCNTNIIPMKICTFIEIIKSDNYEEEKLCLYQHFINKLIFVIYGIKLDITFVVGQLSKYNSNSRKSYL